MKPESAKFWADCINDLFEHDKPYIVAEKYADSSRRGIHVQIAKFDKASWYDYEESGAINWSDSYGVYCMLDQLQVEIDAGEQEIRMFGYTGAGEGCWRTLKRLDNNHWQEFMKWENA